MHFSHLKRRQFITLLGGVVAAWPWSFAALAQRAVKVWRIGHVFPALANTGGQFADAFEQHLMTYFPNRDFNLVRRFAEPKEVDQAVRELVPNIDLLVTWSTIGGVAAKKYASDAIPCVFIAVGAPVDIGLVQSRQATSNTYGDSAQPGKSGRPSNDR